MRRGGRSRTARRSPAARAPGAPSSGLPADTALTEDGLAPRGEGRVLIIACGALAREILYLKRLGRWNHLDLTCLPAQLHLYPEKIPDAVRGTVARYRSAYQRIFVAYADCGTGGLLRKTCDELDVEMIAGPHCYSFFDGNAAFADRGEMEMTAFYLTDFLVRQFETFVIKAMGLDRHPDLRDLYFANYTKLIYLAQTDDPDLTAKAQICAKRLGLSFERRLTGYGDLQTVMAQL
ncbi:MAG: DUF1638 domain-containing protein [Pseudomonadota bacterium]